MAASARIKETMILDSALTGQAGQVKKRLGRCLSGYLDVKKDQQ
jgi:hypothetical protein